jgi:uncharacterized repeat protein (TIGR03803 family)
MTNPGTLALTALASSPSRRFDPGRTSCRLQVACIVTTFWIATAIASPAQSFTTIHSFAGYPTEGAWSHTGLFQGADGNFYGTTTSGGDSTCTFGCGTAFEINAGGTLTTLFNFDFSTGDPSAGLIQANSGNFYGTTSPSGTGGGDAVFELTAGGAFSTLYTFCAQPNCTDGAEPFSGVIQASNGNFYGTTYGGGAFGDGTVFELTAAGTLTTLNSFAGTNGTGPHGLVQATDGNFYGTTYGGGAGRAYRFDGNGTVFEISPGGTLTMLYSFCAQTNCTDGGGPTTLIQAADGNFYGTTLYGGAYGDGTVFKITAGGTLTTIYSFCADPNCSDGNEPTGLMQAADGNFYGTTLYGGGDGVGMIFEIIAGKLTPIHKFAVSAGSYPEGAHPSAGVMQAADGSFYGTTTYGGTSSNCSDGCGTVFSFGLPAATLSTTSLKFGEEALNETSAAKTVTLKNSGVALLVVSNVAVNGNFAISTNTCTGATLTNGKNCNVSVTLTPTAVGLQTGTLRFTDNTGTNPQTVALAGTGIEPATLSPASTTYGAQVVGTTSAAKTFTVINNQTVTLTNIATSATGDFAVSATTCATSLAAKEKCTISVTFTPTQTGTRTGELAVSDSASNSPQTSSLKGTGK